MVPADPRTADCHDEPVVVMRHVDAGIEHQPGTTTDDPPLEDDPPERRRRLLHLAMLSCENQPPHGPSLHTAQLFLDLLTQAVQKAATARQDVEHDKDENDLPTTIQIQIFDTQAGVYPDDWDRFDGFLLPGSFSSAYDTEAWIETLKQVIQTHIVAPQRPTLAVCFGHQILAHSFDGCSITRTPKNNNCIPTPTGPRAGRYTTTLTESGQGLLLLSGSAKCGHSPIILGEDEKDMDRKHIELYYTHNDMVAQLPPCAVSLATSSDGALPVLAAAYYGTSSSSDDARQGEQDGPRPHDAGKCRPYAISFQAHPEYASSWDLGVHRTLHRCCAAMEQTNPHLTQWKNDTTTAASHFDTVQEDSLHVIVAACQLLGWF